MKKFLLLLTLAFVSGCSKSPGLASYWLSWSDEKLIDWQVKSAVLGSNSTAYCSGSLELSTLQSEWTSLALHWASLNGFPYLAISDNNLEFDLYFWPDKRNMVEQRLAQRIALNEALEIDELETIVAAEKGLPAMEWLIFSNDISTDQRCLVLPAIAEYYSAQVDSIVQYHENNPIIQPTWTEKADSKEGASISLNLSVQQINQLSNRLGNSIDEQGNLLPILSEGWRSNAARDIYSTSYATIIQHLKMAHERLDMTVNSQGLLSSQVNHMDMLLTVLNGRSETDPELMLDIQESLLDAARLIEGPLAKDTGVLIGFNNYDGD